MKERKKEKIEGLGRQDARKKKLRRGRNRERDSGTDRQKGTGCMENRKRKRDVQRDIERRENRLLKEETAVIIIIIVVVVIVTPYKSKQSHEGRDYWAIKAEEDCSKTEVTNHHYHRLQQQL